MKSSSIRFLPRRSEDAKPAEKSFASSRVGGLKAAAAAFFLLFVLLCSAANVSGQDVARIRAIYKEVNSAIATCNAAPEEPCGYYLNSLTLNKQGQPWPAVGIFTETTDFWYVRVDNEDEPEYVLRKVNIKTARSNRTESEEYLFDEEGHLLFFFLKSTGNEAESQELRFYFCDGKLIDYAEKVTAAEQQYQILHREDDTQLQLHAKELVELFRRTL